MNTEKFFEAFTELDDDLIENALPKAQEPEIIRPAERIRLWKLLTVAAAVAAVVCGIAVGMKIYSANRHIIAPEDSKTQASLTNTAFSDDTSYDVQYWSIEVDWRAFSSAEELVKNNDIIVSGKVTDISFAMIDSHLGTVVDADLKDSEVELCTIYEIDVITPYKGCSEEKIRFRMQGGLKDYKVDEQIEVLKEYDCHKIGILTHPPKIEEGEEYLFVLHQFEDSLPCIIYPGQTALPLKEPDEKERYSNASVKDITERLIEVNVLHNSQNVSLSFKDTVKLFAEVEDAIIYNNAPLIDLKTKINEQMIKEYSKNGYAITVRHKDMDELPYEGAFNKTSRIISDITVLIGAGDEPSYIAYSYINFSTDGIPEKCSSDTIILGNSPRENILQILENKNGGYSTSDDQDVDDHDDLSVIHNDESITLSEQQSAALTDKVMQSIIDDCLPEYELNTIITEQDIKEYGKNGYVVTLRYNDIDEPLFDGAFDKKSRVVCDVTVLIGGENEPSRIAYSYTLFSLDGASEHHNGGTFNLSSSSRDTILQILNT